MTKMKYIQYVWFHYRSGVKELVREWNGEITRFGDKEIWDSREQYIADWDGHFGDVIYKEIL